MNSEHGVTQQQLQMNSIYHEDEIDLKAFAVSIWRTRKIWLLSMLIASVLFWGGWMAITLLSPAPKTYSLLVKLNFKGVEKQEYPNGSRFDLSDLIAPNVIRSVYEQHKLNQYGISQDMFYSQLRVAPYADDLALIRAKYEGLLADKELKPNEIERLRGLQKQEIDQVVLKGVKLTFSPEKNKVPYNVIDNLLHDIFKIWAYKAVNELGVLNVDLNLVNESVVNEVIISNLDYMLALDYITDKLKLIQSDIEKLEKLPNGLTAKDQETGYTLPDLNNKLVDIQTYLLEPLSGPIQSMGLSKKADVTLHHYLIKQAKLEIQQQEYFRKAEMMGAVYSEYAQTGKYEMASANGKSSAQANVPFSTATAQLSDTFLDRLVQMTEKSSDISFRQALINEKKEMELKAIDIKTQLVEVERHISALQGKGLKLDNELKAYFLKQLEIQLPQLIAELSGVIDIRKRIEKQIVTKSLGNVGYFYTVISDVNVLGGLSKLAFKQVIVYILVLVLVSLIVIPVTMIRNAMRKV